MKPAIAATTDPATPPSPADAHRFVRFFLAVSLAMLGAVAALNYVVNPEGLYPTRVVPPILWGSRPFKVPLLAHAAPQPQALILGSSRVMALPPADFTGATGLPTFNFGVETAKPEDYEVCLRYALQHLHLPLKLLVIGVDVEALHNHEAPHPYLQQPTELGRLMPGQPRFWQWRMFTRLLSRDATVLSLTSLQHVWSGERLDGLTYDADGLAHFHALERKRQASADNLEMEIAANLGRFRPRYDLYDGISADRMAALNRTLTIAAAHHIRVVLFLTPAHPDLVRGLEPHGYRARQVEVKAALRALSQQWQVPFLDLSDPDSFKGDLAGFYDGVHYDPAFAHALAQAVIREGHLSDTPRQPIVNTNKGEAAHALQ